ncbi:unnamed protein product [Citrullus colocynthis]|uniref:Uncharacterized protein n=1 Tax=Citrullus colocynthis TaxID=252529 RepID=A0ABP0XPX8_9ROSI
MSDTLLLRFSSLNQGVSFPSDNYIFLTVKKKAKFFDLISKRFPLVSFFLVDCLYLNFFFATLSEAISLTNFAARI